MWEDFCKIWSFVGKRERDRERRRERGWERDRKRRQDPEVRERRREYDRKRRQNPEFLERDRERQREYRQKPAARERHRERGRSLQYRCQRYGITYEFVTQVYMQQNGMCLFCDFKFPALPDNLDGECPDVIHFDHDHKSDKFRGLLCRICNINLGSIEKFFDKGLLVKSVQYIYDHR